MQKKLWRNSWSKKILCLFVLPLLAACSDQRAMMPIEAGGLHNLTLIRETVFPWDNFAKYAIIAYNMPHCTRRHALPDASLNTRIEIYSPGNRAWIVRYAGGKRMYVVETRTCEGFAELKEEPATGLGEKLGTFVMKNDVLIFRPEEKAEEKAAK